MCGLYYLYNRPGLKATFRPGLGLAQVSLMLRMQCYNVLQRLQMSVSNDFIAEILKSSVGRVVAFANALYTYYNNEPTQER